MLNLRIQGLVSLSKSIRDELASSITSERLEQLRTLASEVLSRVRFFLQQHRATPRDLPAPTRAAYDYVNQFIAQGLEAAPKQNQPSLFDSSSFPTAAKLARNLPPAICLPGLTTRVNQMSARLSAIPDAGATSLLKSRIADASRRAESQIAAKRLAPENLTLECRAARGWLAYFSHGELVDRYLHAVQLATPILREAARAKPRLVREPASLTLVFKPLHGYYVLRRGQLNLPTAMIAFNAEQFQTLAHMVFGDDHDARHGLFGAVMSKPFQAIRVELDRLGGIVEKPAGIAHDLSASFTRVNARYFASSINRPALVWSRTLTGRKFGHYDFIQDTVMLSRSLDHHAVPELLIDYIMFHELLHKKHGIRWANGRHHAHTPDFRREEKKFEGHREAEVWLQQLASHHRQRRGR